MATATQHEPMTLTDGGRFDARRGEYRCQCGQVLRVFGGGRHRIYFEPGDADPVMNRACPHCGRGLPGKNRPGVADPVVSGGRAAR